MDLRKWFLASLREVGMLCSLATKKLALLEGNMVDMQKLLIYSHHIAPTEVEMKG